MIFSTQLDGYSSYDIAILSMAIGLKSVIEFRTLSKFRVLLNSSQRGYVVHLSSVAHLIISTIILYALVKLDVGITYIKLVSLLSVFIRTLILYVYVKINYKFLDYSKNSINFILTKRKDSLIIHILEIVIRSTPIIFVTLLFQDYVLTSIFSVYLFIYSGVSGLLEVFKSGLSASFGDLIAKNETEKLKNVYNTFEYAFYILVTIIAGIACVSYIDFVGIYTKGINDGDYILPTLAVLFTYNIFLTNLVTPQRMLINSAGVYKEMKVQSIIELGLAITLQLVLGYLLGLNGLVIGLLISHLFRIIILTITISKLVTKTSILRSFKRQTISLVTLSVIALFNFITTWTLSNSYTDWIFNTFVKSIIIVVFVVPIFIAFEPSIVKKIIMNFDSLIKRR
jgi:hypothetical protein